MIKERLNAWKDALYKTERELVTINKRKKALEEARDSMISKIEELETLEQETNKKEEKENAD